uniref:Uncharacterized protein n=1 Tax=Phocoena sinus TaxID=42100 RepID=A0A8C9CFN8_PHOSS
MGADLTHPWGLGSSIRASVPQGPPCHTVTAVLRDQDKVLLPAPVFSYGTCTDKFHHPPGNLMLEPMAGTSNCAQLQKEKPVWQK